MTQKERNKLINKIATYRYENVDLDELHQNYYVNEIEHLEQLHDDELLEEDQCMDSN